MQSCSQVVTGERIEGCVYCTFDSNVNVARDSCNVTFYSIFGFWTMGLFYCFNSSNQHVFHAKDTTTTTKLSETESWQQRLNPGSLTARLNPGLSFSNKRLSYVQNSSTACCLFGICLHDNGPDRLASARPR